MSVVKSFDPRLFGMPTISEMIFYTKIVENLKYQLTNVSKPSKA